MFFFTYYVHRVIPIYEIDPTIFYTVQEEQFFSILILHSRLEVTIIEQLNEYDKHVFDYERYA